MSFWETLLSLLKSSGLTDVCHSIWLSALLPRIKLRSSGLVPQVFLPAESSL